VTLAWRGREVRELRSDKLLETFGRLDLDSVINT
jgi:hypothetical protein